LESGSGPGGRRFKSSLPDHLFSSRYTPSKSRKIPAVGKNATVLTSLISQWEKRTNLPIYQPLDNAFLRCREEQPSIGTRLAYAESADGSNVPCSNRVIRKSLWPSSPLGQIIQIKLLLDDNVKMKVPTQTLPIALGVQDRNDQPVKFDSKLSVWKQIDFRNRRCALIWKSSVHQH